MKKYTTLCLLVLIMASLSHCSSAQKLQKEPPVNIIQAYYQSWVAGIQGGGSGINLFIEVEDYSKTRIQFDSVYFNGRASKIEIKPGNANLLVGRFSSSSNQKQDIIMSNKPHEEYGNKPPVKPSVAPFDLKKNECVISYSENNKKRYFKIVGIEESRTVYYPSTPPKKQ